MNDKNRASRLIAEKQATFDALRKRLKERSLELYELLDTAGLVSVQTEFSVKFLLKLDEDGLFLESRSIQQREYKILVRFNDREWPDSAKDSKTRTDYISAAKLLPKLKELIFKRLEGMVAETNAALELLENM